MRTRHLLFLAMMLGVLLLSSPAAHALLSVGTAAPDFTLPTADNKQFTLSDNFKDPPKVVLLNFWFMG